MSNVRVISFNNLRERLRSVLGEESLLFERFDLALKTENDELVALALDNLNSYPESTRKAVQDVLLAWLFDSADTSGLEDSNVVARLPN